MLSHNYCSCSGVKPACSVRCGRAAYTMLELVIVLAIIGTLATLSFPVLMRPLAKSDVQQAAQDLTRLVLNARIRSMETGTEHRLRWRPGTSEYELTEVVDRASRRTEASKNSNLSPYRSATQKPLPASTQEKGLRPKDRDPPMRRPYRVAQRLANNVVFALDVIPGMKDSVRRDPSAASRGVVDLDRGKRSRLMVDSAQRRDSLQPATVAAHGRSLPGHHHLPWSKSISFFPDGRTSTMTWTLRSPDAYLADVMLRGLTGTVQVSSVRQAEWLLPEGDGSSLAPSSSAVSQPTDGINGAPVRRESTDRQGRVTR